MLKQLLAILAFFSVVKSLQAAGTNLYDIKTNITNSLLNGYEPTVDPRVSPSEPVPVLLTPFITQIVAMDDKKRLLTVNVLYSMVWNDSRLSWDSKKFEADDLTLPLEKVWSPSVSVFNDVSVINKHHDLDRRGGQVLIKPNGTVKVILLRTLKIPCNMDKAGDLFYDKHHCTAYFSDWMHDDITPIHLEVTRTWTASTPFVTSHSHWHLVNASLSSRVITVQETPGLTVACVKLDLLVERQSLAREYQIIAPAMLILLLVTFSYLLPADGGERIFLCMTCLLAFSVMLFFATDRLTMLIIAMIIVACITIFLNIFNVNLYNWAYLDYRCPRGVTDFLNYSSNRWFLSSPDKNTETYQTEEIVATRKSVHGWVELSRFLDRLFFVLTTLVDVGLFVWVLSKKW